MPRRASPSRSASILVPILLAAALLIFLFPLPTDIDTLRRLTRLARAPERSLVIIGNSVIDHRSRCDSDERTIAEMLGALTSRPVVNASFGGQNFSTALGFAAVAVRHPRVGGVVFPVSLALLSGGSTLDAHSEGFFQIAGGAYATFDVVGRMLRLEPISADLRQGGQPFTYRGRAIPDYNGIKTFFLSQSSSAGCPETLGTDPLYVEALHWNQNLRYPVDRERLADIVTLGHEARRRGKSFAVVLMPYDAGDIAALNPSLLGPIRAREQEVRRIFRSSGIDLVDLAEAVPKEAFADRWCACGHLQERGRMTVATAVANRIR